MGRGEFESLALDELDALREALREKRERDAQKEARHFALLCNLHAGGKKVWKPEDFLASADKIEGPEAEAAIQAYMAERQRKRKDRATLELV